MSYTHLMVCKHKDTGVVAVTSFISFPFSSKHFYEPVESFTDTLLSFYIYTCTMCFSFDLGLPCSCFYKLSGFFCPSVTSALVVRLQQLQISHHYTREIEGSRPLLCRFIELALNAGLLLVEPSPSCSSEEMLPVCLDSHLL